MDLAPMLIRKKNMRRWRYENVMGRHKWNHLSSTIKTVMWKVSPRKE
ncbi:hypothetical protein ISN45_Aa06g015400, partial [Arabidopsis thaliana x Arabidopsis arenosa]